MLIIVKTIKLLDDFHYNVFRTYVKDLSIRSYFPLALIDVIDRTIEKDQGTDYLCKAVYSEVDEKSRKKFYQLAHYTFGLTSFLAKNYPDYLQHNISKFQRLVNDGALDKANVLADMLLEISEKIEDYPTQAKILTILGQQSILMESSKQASSFLGKAKIALDHQNTITSLFERFYTVYNLKTKPSKEDIEDTLAYFKTHFNHTSIVASLTSQYCYCFFLHFLKDNRFFTKETIDLLKSIDHQLEKNNYIVFPYLVDFIHRVRFLKLRYELLKVDIKDILEKSEELLHSNKDILYWNSYINQPEMFILNIQANFYISNYMKSYKHDSEDWLPEEIRTKLEQLKKDCKTFLTHQHLEQKFTLRFINLTTIYCSLLLVDGRKKNLEEAIILLNQTLTSYQQVSFQAYADAIYSILGITYFCLEDFENVENNYARYRKATNKKTVNPANDMTIHGFYYAAKWLETEREQYAKKLGKIIKEAHTDRFQSIRNTLEELINYYKIPKFL